MVAVSGPYWRADRREYYVQWRWNGMRLHVPISAAACGEDQATAERVAQRVKELVQSVASPDSTDAFLIYRDECVAEEVAGTSDRAAASSAITVPAKQRRELTKALEAVETQKMVVADMECAAQKMVLHLQEQNAMAIEDLLSQRNSQVSRLITISGNLSDDVFKLGKALVHMTQVKDELEDQNKTLLQENSELREKLLYSTLPASTSQQQDRPANINNSLRSPKSWDMYRTQLDELNSIRARAGRKS